MICGGFPSFRSTDGGKTCRGKLRRTAARGREGGVAGRHAYARGICRLCVRPISAAASVGKKSTDSGHTWKAVALPEGIPFHIYAHMYFVTSQKGWISMADGKMLYTADGGQSWQWQLAHGSLPRGLFPVPPAWPASLPCRITISSASARHCLRLATGGRSWTPVLSGAKQVNAIFALGPWQVWPLATSPALSPTEPSGDPTGTIEMAPQEKNC